VIFWYESVGVRTSKAESRLSWTGLETGLQQAGALHWSFAAASACMISEFRCCYSASFSFYIRFIILCQSCFAVSFLFCAQATCEQAFVLSVCITVIYTNSQ